MDTLNYAATNIQRVARGHLVRAQKWNKTVEDFIPDFFGSEERLSTPVIPTELLLPIRLRREECLFKIDVIYDNKEEAYCFIFVEDFKMKMYTLVQPVGKIVAAFRSIQNFNIDNHVLDEFTEKYAELSSKHWEAILDLENLQTDRRKRKLVVKKKLDQMRPRLYMTRKVSFKSSKRKRGFNDE